jgi:CheY-like chemotaxis protein
MNTPSSVVLVVEDDADLRAMFRTALRFGGFEVKEASNGYIALQLIDQEIPAAIVLDIRMPRVSGLEVLREVAGQPHTRHIPVIVVTADPTFAGTPSVACLLRKPVAPEQLVKTVHACIADSRRSGPAGV